MNLITRSGFRQPGRLNLPATRRQIAPPETAARATQGFTLVEVLVAILILGLVISTSLAVFLDRTRRVQQATESILAWQALSNEAELRRRIDFKDLDAADDTFLSDVSILAPLPGVSTSVSVKIISPTVKHVTMAVVWRKGAQSARLRLIRTDTGGSNLW